MALRAPLHYLELELRITLLHLPDIAKAKEYFDLAERLLEEVAESTVEEAASVVGLCREMISCRLQQLKSKESLSDKILHEAGTMKGAVAAMLEAYQEGTGKILGCEWRVQVRCWAARGEQG